MPAGVEQAMVELVLVEDVGLAVGGEDQSVVQPDRAVRGDRLVPPLSILQRCELQIRRTRVVVADRRAAISVIGEIDERDASRLIDGAEEPLRRLRRRLLREAERAAGRVLVGDAEAAIGPQRKAGALSCVAVLSVDGRETPSSPVVARQPQVAAALFVAPSRFLYSEKF